MAAAYLARWAGPVNETDDPYSYNLSSPDSTTSNSPQGLPPQKHVQNINVYPRRNGPLDNNTLKNALMTDGALDTSMAWNDNAYNSTNAAYYYNGTAEANHAVTLVGWDDNYAASNFNSPNPPGNGAFLIKNSYGTSWGNDGFFWISYYDTRYAIRDESYANLGSEPVTNYVRKYEYDPLGLVTGWGQNGTMAWFANVFTAAASEPLAAVSFYVASNNSPYLINIYTNVTGANPTSGTLALTTSGTLPLAGYHTIVLPGQVPLVSGQKFAVVVQLTTPGYSQPIPISYALKNYSSNATASPGQGFISADGNSWQDATAYGATCSVALKAFTFAPAGDYVLTVNSTNPASGVAITVSPADVNNNNNGSTPFTRTYARNIRVTLTASATNFSSWSGCDSASGPVCTVTMNTANAVTANYVGYALTVNSANPANGVTITVSPADLNGSSDGSTSFTRTYAANAQVTLTAPAANLSSWTNCDSPNNNVCTMTMTGAKTVTANYPTASSYTVTVNSADPASGVAVTASPADLSGNSSGSTSFALTYATNAKVTLTAPATIASGNFSFWSGCDSAPSNVCTVTMTSAKAVTANYLAVKYTLTVNSTASGRGTPITASPADIHATNSGNTNFALIYYQGASVTLTAPATASGNSFVAWTGCDQTSNTSCTVAMNASKTVQANYTGMPRVLTLPKVRGTTAVTVNGIVVSNGILTSYNFEYGSKQTLSKYKRTTSQTLQPSMSESAVNATLAGLTPQTLYYYRVVATNTAGTSRGQILAFRSGGTPQKTSGSTEGDGTNSTSEAAPVAVPAESANRNASSTGSPLPTARNTNPGSGTSIGTQTAILEVTPGRNAPLVLRLGDIPAGTVTTTACADLPRGATCSYDDGNQTMTITPAANTPAGSYPVRVIFTAGTEVE
jgi:hypothetical protein